MHQLTGTNSQLLGHFVLSLARGRESLGSIDRDFHVPKLLLIFRQLAGDLTQVETPVPIPNTADKHLGPMVVRTARE